MPIFDPGHGEFVVADGLIVERDALDIVQRIKEYDENLDVICLDPVRADSPADAPFILCETRPDGRMVRIFEFWKLDASILERIILADGQRFDALDRTITIEQLQKKQREARYADRHGELKDILAVGMKIRKSSYVIKNHEGEEVKINESAPVEYNRNRFFSHAS